MSGKGFILPSQARCQFADPTGMENLVALVGMRTKEPHREGLLWAATAYELRLDI